MVADIVMLPKSTVNVTECRRPCALASRISSADLNLIPAVAPSRNSFAIQLVYSDCSFYANIGCACPIFVPNQLKYAASKPRRKDYPAMDQAENRQGEENSPVWISKGRPSDATFA